MTSCSSETPEEETKKTEAEIKPSIIQKFVFQQAKWKQKKKAGDSYYLARGKAPEGAEITLVNARLTSKELAKLVAVNNKWEIKVKLADPSLAPCRIKAIFPNGESIELDVQDAPEECDAG